MKYSEMNTTELQKALDEAIKKYDEFKELKLNLNMARGNPSKALLNLSMPMLDVINSSTDCTLEDGTDARNYGGLPGIPEARKLFADYLEATTAETIVCGNASLSVMYDLLAAAMLFGNKDSERPWCKEKKIKFLCPIPGYDRHFSITEALGIEMINIPLNEWGPDMDMVREAVKDPAVKGMWIVPKYTNPYGGCYSDEAIKELAAIKPAAKDFRIFCDNAYGYHWIYKDVPVLSIFNEAKKCGNADMVYTFASTSKITFAGAGVACMCASEENIKHILGVLGKKIISYDKMNQLRHVKFFKNLDGLRKSMAEHAELIRPNFDAALNTLDEELSGLDAGTWVKPDGGYFITFMGNKGTAKRTYELVKGAGVTMTPPGSTHPYHKDPDDSYLRIAPSYPPTEELVQAIKIFCCAVKIASLEKYLESAK